MSWAEIRLPLALIAAALLAGCDSSPRAGNGGNPAEVEAPPVDMLGRPLAPEAAAHLRARVEAALAGRVPDPARHANLRQGIEGATCGQVETGPRSELHPFVLTPDGVVTISESPTIRPEDPFDPFPDLHMRYCATVEELRRLDVQLNALPPAPVTSPQPDLPPLEDIDELPAEGEEEAPPPVAPRGGDEESFFNAVVRPPPRGGR